MSRQLRPISSAAALCRVSDAQDTVFELGRGSGTVHSIRAKKIGDTVNKIMISADYFPGTARGLGRSGQCRGHFRTGYRFRQGTGLSASQRQHHHALETGMAGMALGRGAAAGEALFLRQQTTAGGLGDQLAGRSTGRTGPGRDQTEISYLKNTYQPTRGRQHRSPRRGSCCLLFKFTEETR